MSNPYVPLHLIGDSTGNNGTEFDLRRFSQGRIVKRIGVHFDPKTCLRGISISYENGEQATTGTLQGSYSEITLEPGETIRRASLWGNGVGTRTGRIWFETDGGRTFNAGRDTTGQDEFPITVGSGILAGFVGYSGVDIFLLGFVFIKPVRSTEITNVEYILPSGDNIVPHALVSDARFSNDQSSGTITWDFSNSVQRTSSVTFTSSVTLEFSMSLSVSAGVPGIASVESGFSWRVGATQTWSRTNETVVTFAWNLGGSLQPGEEVTCSATCQYGSASVPYTANVRHVFTDNHAISYTDSGTLESAEYAFAVATSRTGRIRGGVHELQESEDADAVVALGDSGIKSRL